MWKKLSPKEGRKGGWIKKKKKKKKRTCTISVGHFQNIEKAQGATLISSGVSGLSENLRKKGIFHN